MQLSQSHPTAVACRALGVPRASLYRERRRRRGLVAEESDLVLKVLVQELRDPWSWWSGNYRR